VFDLGTDDDAITSDDSTNYDPPKISGQDDNVDLISHTLTTDNSANYDPPKIHQVISGQEGNFNVIPHDSDVGLEYDKGMFYTSTSFSNSIKNPTDNQSEIEQATSFEHSIAADEQAGLILQQLHDKVRLYYHLFQSDSSFLLTCHHYLFTYRTLDQRLLQSIDHINSWLRSVEEAKQVLLHHIQQEQEAAGTFFSISTNLRGDTQEDSSYHPTGTTSLTSAYLTPSTMFTTSSSTPTDDSSLTSKSTMGTSIYPTSTNDPCTDTDRTTSVNPSSNSSQSSSITTTTVLLAVLDLVSHDETVTSDNSANYDPPMFQVITGQDDNFDVISHTLTSDNSANYDPPKIKVISCQDGNVDVILHDSNIGVKHDKEMFYTSTSFFNSKKEPTNNQTEIEPATVFDHSIAVDEQAGLILQQLHDKVRQHYQLFQSDSSFLLTCHHYLFTQMTLDQRLLHSTDHLNSWLRSVEEAKQVLRHHTQQEQAAARTFFSITTNLRGDTTENFSYHPTTTSLMSTYLTPSKTYTLSSSTPTEDSSLISTSTMDTSIYSTSTNDPCTDTDRTISVNPSSNCSQSSSSSMSTTKVSMRQHCSM
jgi:glutamate racemase